METHKGAGNDCGNMTTHREPPSSVLETIGETPLVRVHDSPDAVPVYAKLESFNPGASIKDRIGKYMLERMLERGDVGGGHRRRADRGQHRDRARGRGQAVRAERGVRRSRAILGGETAAHARARRGGGQHPERGRNGVRHRPCPRDRRRARRRGRPQQFSNPLNAEAHYETTAPEIDEALDGEVGAVVAGCGTGGTLMGMARYFRERDPDTYVVAVEPAGSVPRVPRRGGRPRGVQDGGDRHPRHRHQRAVRPGPRRRHPGRPRP